MSNYVWVVALMGLGGLMLAAGCKENSEQVKSRGRFIGKFAADNSPIIYLWEIDGQEYLATYNGGLIKHTKMAENDEKAN